MGTKNNPAPFDCYANAEPDEPMFVLLGRDVTAAAVVREWADLREQLDDPDDAPQIAEARTCADAMETWWLASDKAKDQVGDHVGEIMFGGALHTPDRECVLCEAGVTLGIWAQYGVVDPFIEDES